MIATDSWKMLSEILIDNNFAVAYHGQSKEEIKEAHFFNREKVRGLLKRMKIVILCIEKKRLKLNLITCII